MKKGFFLIVLMVFLVNPGFCFSQESAKNSNTEEPFAKFMHETDVYEKADLKAKEEAALHGQGSSIPGVELVDFSYHGVNAHQEDIKALLDGKTKFISKEDKGDITIIKFVAGREGDAPFKGGISLDKDNIIDFLVFPLGPDSVKSSMKNGM